VKIIPHQQITDSSRRLARYARHSLRLLSSIVALELGYKSFIDSPNQSVIDIFSVTIGIVSLLYIVLNTWSQIIFYKYTAEKRKDLIDNGLGSNILSFKSQGYFSNDSLQPGIYKLAVNTYENCFFSYHTSREMRTRNVIQSILLVALFVVSAFLGQNEILLLMVKIPIISIIIIGTFRLNSFVNSTSSICNSFADFFNILAGRKTLSGSQNAVALKNAMDYEALIAWSTIHMNKKIFDRKNEELSQQWTELKRSKQI
jgi:hypothetical protein